MAGYLLKRILLIIPTLFGIMLISFAIVQFAPGGPVERVLAQLSGTDVAATARIGGSAGDGVASGQSQAGGDAGSTYRGAQGLDKEFIEQLNKQFGFDKPLHEQFFLMMKNYLTFDFGKSYFRDVSVLQLIKEKLPVSISLGIWMLLVTYLCRFRWASARRCTTARGSTPGPRASSSSAMPFRASWSPCSCSWCSRAARSSNGSRCAA